MKKELFDNIKDKADNIRITPSKEAWEKFERQREVKFMKPQASIIKMDKSRWLAAASVVLLISNLVLLGYLLGKNNSMSSNYVLMDLDDLERPISQQVHIMPYDQYQKVVIREGDQNRKLVNQSPTSLSNNWNRSLFSIWTDIDNGIEFTLMPKGEDALILSLTHGPEDKLYMQMDGYNGENLTISKQSGNFMGLDIQRASVVGNTLILEGNKGRIQFTTKESDNQLQLEYINNNKKGSYLLEKAL